MATPAQVSHAIAQALESSLDVAELTNELSLERLQIIRTKRDRFIVEVTTNGEWTHQVYYVTVLVAPSDEYGHLSQ